MKLLQNFGILGFLSIVGIISPATTLESSLRHLLPSKNDCGLKTSNGDFSWVAFLSCEDSDGAISSSSSSDRDFAVTSKDCDCSGVLITEQYILTSGNCALAKWAGLGQLEQNSNKNCSIDDHNCSPSKLPFSEQILHPDKTIRLIRLATKISYSDHLRPICLPIYDEHDKITNEDEITSSEWIIDGKARGLVRSELSHTIQSNENCSRNFEILSLVNSSKYMCTAMADELTVLCKTDSGAPMMYKRNNNWILGGILHAGFCLEKSAVANRITPEVVSWILENIKI